MKQEKNLEILGKQSAPAHGRRRKNGSWSHFRRQGSPHEASLLSAVRTFGRRVLEAIQGGRESPRMETINRREEKTNLRLVGSRMATSRETAWQVTLGLRVSDTTTRDATLVAQSQHDPVRRTSLYYIK